MEQPCWYVGFWLKLCFIDRRLVDGNIKTHPPSRDGLLQELHHAVGMLDAVFEGERRSVAHQAGVARQTLVPQPYQGLRVVPSQALRYQG